MKVKNASSITSFTLLLSLLCLLLSCNNKQEKVENKTIIQDSDKITQTKPTEAPAVIKDDSLISALSKVVLTSLKNKDYKAFTAFFHPVEGVRFSPYASVDTTYDLTFKADDFIKQLGQKKKINWGPYSAGEEDILMAATEYMKKFVYNADFLNAEETKLNEMIGSSTTNNNLKEIYPNCPFTESYFSGFEKKFDGMDWCSLRLVFKKHLDKYYLIGIIHDQWTT